MNTRYIHIFSLSAFALACCVDLRKPPELANCSAKNPCIDELRDSGRPDAKDVSYGPEAIPSMDPDATLSDTQSSEDSTQPDAIIPGPEVSIDARPDVRDTALAEAPPDTNVPDSLIPDTNQPDTSVPDTSVPDSGVPDSRLPDTSVPDTSLPDTRLPDASTSANCPTVYIRSGGNVVSHPGLDGYCIVTCDDLAQPYFGWGCYNFAGREVKVNGQAVTCGQIVLPDKVNGHYVFEITAGSENSSAINWWNQTDIKDCPYTKDDPLP